MPVFRSERTRSRRRLAWAPVVLALLCAASAAMARELTPADYRGAPKDLVLWGELAKVGVLRHSGRMQVTFLPAVQALDGRTVTLVGFMSAIDEGKENKRFLLTSKPLNCSHCVPMVASDIVEVTARAPEWLRQVPVLVRGRLRLVPDATEGPIYRLQDAVMVQRQP